MNPNRKIEAKALTDHELSEVAEQTLSEHHPSAEFPVPIEDIAELQLGINIIPVPNLKRDKGIDAYISHDFGHIIIDDYCYNNFLERTRFSVAHEVGHFLLHKPLYEEQGIETEDDLIVFTNSMPPHVLRRIEWQSYALAGFLLVPRSRFKPIVDNVLDLTGGAENLTLLDLGTLVDDLKHEFQVSGDVIQRRFRTDYSEIYESFFRTE